MPGTEATGGGATTWPIEAYLERARARRFWTDRTVSDYRWILRDAERFCRGRPLRQEHLLPLLLRWRGRTPNMSPLKAFAAWAGWGLDWPRFPRAAPVRPLTWYTLAEMEVAVEACRTPRERLVLHLALELMLRRVEIERLTRDDVREDHLVLRGKGRMFPKIRRVPLHPYTTAILAAWTGRTGSTTASSSSPGSTRGSCAAASPGCSTSRGTSGGASAATRATRTTASPSIGTSSGSRTAAAVGLRRSGLDGELRRISRRAGIHLTFHALRRTGGRLFVRAGIEAGKGPLEVLNELRGIYGHEDLRTTMHYVGWDLEAAAETMARMPRIGEMAVRETAHPEATGAPARGARP